MKRAVTAVLLIILIAGIAQVWAAPVYGNPDNGLPKWTIMVYLDADNNLDPYGALNLKQIYEGFDIGTNVNVVVLFDSLNEGAYLCDIKNNKNESLGEIDMASSDILKVFVENVTTSCQSDYYMLILWDHGLGWPGVCWDESSGGHLTAHDISVALEVALNGKNKKIDIIGFDACLMGMIEICYELKDVTDIVIGSEMLVPGYGWPYKELMQYISDNPNVDPETLSGVIVNQYVDYYSKIRPNFFVQLSAISTSQIDQMADDLKDLTDYLSDNIGLFRGLVTGARSASQQKFVLGTMGVLFYSDLYKFADLLQKRTTDLTLKAYASDLMTSIDNIVLAESHTRPQGNLDQKQYGLTVYFPPNIQLFSPKYSEYVEDFASGTGWYELLLKYYGVS